MATYTRLASGNWRAQVRKLGLYKAKSFKREAQAWATRIEADIDSSDAGLISPRGSLAELIDDYKTSTPARGRSWSNYLDAWKADLGHVKLSKLSRVHIQA
jgi:integrase